MGLKLTIYGPLRALHDGHYGNWAPNPAALADLPAVDADLERQFGIGRPESAETLAASVMRPALNVRGFRAGEVGASAARLVRLEWKPGYPALRTDMTSPPARAVIATVRGATHAPLAVLPMMGGSVPLNVFAEIFRVPVIGLPIVNHDNDQHAADENLRIQNLCDGIDTYAALMGRLDW